MKYHRDEDYEKFESTFANIFQKRFSLITKYVKYGKVLDIGCSNGVFLDIFKNAGFETWGVEPSDNGKKAEEKGHKVVNTNFEEAILPKNYFDLVVMNHTLEHLDDPGLVLKKVHKILNTTGVLFCDVPNAGGIGSRLLGNYWPLRLPNEHKWQFTKKSLSVLIKNSGFKILYWESRSGFFEYANPILEFKRKRFIMDLLFLPYSLLATLLNLGDSMSFIAKKK